MRNMLVSHEVLVESFRLHHLHRGIIFMHGFGLQRLQSDQTFSSTEFKLFLNVRYACTSIDVVAPVLCFSSFGRLLLSLIRTLPSHYHFDMTAHHLHPALDLPPVLVDFCPSGTAAPLLVPPLLEPSLALSGRRIFKVGLIQPPPLWVMRWSLNWDELNTKLGGREAAYHWMGILLEATHTQLGRRALAMVVAILVIKITAAIMAFTHDQ